MSSPHNGLQEHVKGLRIGHLEELYSTGEVLNGLWECLPPATDSYNERTAITESNIKRATSLKNALNDLVKLQSTVKELHNIEDTARSNWSSLEQSMYSKSEPYSQVGIAKRIEKEVADCTAISSKIEKQIIDPELKPDEVIILVKRFLEARQQMYLKQNMLENIK